jgi:hypothetical protein
MLRILEISWLMIVLLGASLGTFKLMTETLTSAIWFYMFTVVAFVFFIVRRRQRIRLERKAGSPAK